VPPTEPTAPAPAPDSGTNDIGNTVDQVDDTVTDATGIDLGLGDKTKGVTDIVDGAVGGLTGGRGLGLENVDLTP